MIYENPEYFINDINEFNPLIGVDLGTKTIGIAVSDRLIKIANAAFVIKRKKFSLDAQIIYDFVNETSSGGIVIGLPKNMDGSEGARAQSTRAFARNLEKFLTDKPLPILLWDERLSTVEAERAMIEADMSRKKRGEKIDAVAAALILQGALDRIGVIGHG